MENNIIMENLYNRRTFIKMGGLAFAGMGSHYTPIQIKDSKKELERYQKAVKFTRDGIDMTPLEYSHMLFKLSEQGEIKPDNYSNGGIVEELEQKFARLLGKESAVFMPTGTLANHIAIRKLADHRKKVIVQAESHIYNDSGDCAQILSGLNLIPLGKGRPDFSLNDVEQVIEKTNAGRVSTEVGVISIESPVRRQHNKMFDYEEMKKIAGFARKNKIKLHMDGARLFNASAHSGLAPNRFAELFDTVYVSLYKNFNAPSGAILAGPLSFTKDLYHMRRMFGGGLAQAWPFAAIALKFAESFLEEYSEALKRAGKFFNLLEQSPEFRIERIPNGTNVFKLHLNGTDAEKFRFNILKVNIELPVPQSSGKEFVMKINTTLNRETPELLVKKFRQAL